ncbi:MAG: flavin oxidoreductase/NADH oxidase [Bacillota bacterium]
MRFAASGAGLIWFEAVAVTNEGRANPRQLFLNENTKASFKALIADMRKCSMDLYGFEPVIIMQMTHSGRFSKPNGTPEPIVAYRNAHWEIGKEDQPYTIADDDYCDYVVERYGATTKLAEEVGFDGIDVKCCHGYLFNEFLSAFNREGRYGGSLENRSALYLKCIDAVKANAKKGTIITTRFNGTDTFPYPYGYGVDENSDIDLTETKWIIAQLVARGIELLNLTIGNPYLIPHINRPCLNSPEDPEDGMKRLYKVTKELQKEFPSLAIIMSGLTYRGADAMEYAEKMLQDGVATFVGFGRMTFAYPDFYQDYLKMGTLDKKKCCLKCSKCTELMRAGSVTGCPIRDKEVYMPIYREKVMGVK